MKSFRTELPVGPVLFHIRHPDPVLTIGSCFADSIGGKLQSNKFIVSANPLGTLYNPPSLHQALRYLVGNELPPQGSCLENAGTWYHYDFHSSLSGSSRPELEAALQHSIGTAHQFLRQTKVLIITYGTARIYERKDNGSVVANCHKVPATQFHSTILSPESVADSFSGIYQDLCHAIPGIRIILTVSPVRHVRDTLELNSVSKSVLRYACQLITSRHAEVAYFPAYEIMMDDLRDYRFYEPDMIHPSGEAIDYIWEKFSTAYFAPETLGTLKKWMDVLQALNHRPFHPASPSHQLFLADTLRKLEELKSAIPVDEEIARLRAQQLPHA